MINITNPSTGADQAAIADRRRVIGDLAVSMRAYPPHYRRIVQVTCGAFACLSLAVVATVSHSIVRVAEYLVADLAVAFQSAQLRLRRCLAARLSLLQLLLLLLRDLAHRWRHQQLARCDSNANNAKHDFISSRRRLLVGQRQIREGCSGLGTL
jgi:hypothetical protein